MIGIILKLILFLNFLRDRFFSRDHVVMYGTHLAVAAIFVFYEYLYKISLKKKIHSII